MLYLCVHFFVCLFGFIATARLLLPASCIVCVCTLTLRAELTLLLNILSAYTCGWNNMHTMCTNLLMHGRLPNAKAAWPISSSSSCSSRSSSVLHLICTQFVSVHQMEGIIQSNPRCTSIIAHQIGFATQQQHSSNSSGEKGGSLVISCVRCTLSTSSLCLIYC